MRTGPGWVVRELGVELLPGGSGSKPLNYGISMSARDLEAVRSAAGVAPGAVSAMLLSVYDGTVLDLSPLGRCWRPGDEGRVGAVPRVTVLPGVRDGRRRGLAAVVAAGRGRGLPGAPGAAPRPVPSVPPAVAVELGLAYARPFPRERAVSLHEPARWQP